MRKLIAFTATIAALAGAAIALAGQGATNASGEYIDLNVAVSPPVAGTAKAPRGVGVQFDSFVGNRVNGNIPSHSTNVLVRFNKGFKTNGLLFPSCKINPTALSKCPKNTQMGSGTGEGKILGTNGAPPTFVPATLAVYNGKPFKGKAPTMIIIGSLNGRPATELDFTVKQQPIGPYGLAFLGIVFPNSGPAPFEISKFSVKIPDRTITHKVHGKSVKTHLLEAPTTCNGSWVFAQTNSFTDQPPLTATDSQPCVKG